MKDASLTSGKECILVVDDDPAMLEYTQALLASEPYRIELARNAAQAVQLLEQGLAPDLILLDIAQAGTDGLQAVEACRAARPGQKIVVFSCLSHPDVIVQALRYGAVDFIAKPFYKSDLDQVLRRCLASRSERARDNSHVESVAGGLSFVAASPAMKQIRTRLAQVAAVDMPVLLLGESGVGKEVLARLIHQLSARADKPFLKVNCAALPLDLLESELFGYEAGAFTGASRSKPGMFELCHGGTLFLDEIGEMSPSLQAKLLHVLQDGQFSRLGARTVSHADVRIVAATNINVQKAMETRGFREDLYYRLSAFTIKVPPLRERREEIPLLFRHFLNEFSRRYAHQPPAYSQRLIAACTRHDWPGNLRELENFVKRFLVLKDERLSISELEQEPEPEIETADKETSCHHSEEGTCLKMLVRRLKERAEEKVIEEVLASNNWNCKLAATHLHISYKALLYKIKQYGISPAPGSEDVVAGSVAGMRSTHA
jgi:DNA-binding NtrC family response regulator